MSAPAPAPAPIVTNSVSTTVANEPSKYNKIMYGLYALIALVIIGFVIKNKEYQRDIGLIAVVGLTVLLVSLIIDVFAFSKCEESKKFIKKPMYLTFLIICLILGTASLMLKSRGTILAETAKIAKTARNTKVIELAAVQKGVDDVVDTKS